MKKSNKGFSLVELIIVIAIMAILAAAIAPALIRYIDKSRKADDVQFFGQINTAASAALANEDAYEAVAASIGTTNAVWTGTFDNTGAVTNPSDSDEFVKEVNSTVGTGNKLKYTKGAKNTTQKNITVVIDADEKVHVNVGGAEVIPTVATASSWK